jgi:hypothetical protein
VERQTGSRPVVTIVAIALAIVVVIAVVFPPSSK